MGVHISIGVTSFEEGQIKEQSPLANSQVKVIEHFIEESLVDLQQSYDQEEELIKHISLDPPKHYR